MYVSLAESNMARPRGPPFLSHQMDCQETLQKYEGIFQPEVGLLAQSMTERVDNC